MNFEFSFSPLNLSNLQIVSTFKKWSDQNLLKCSPFQEASSPGPHQLQYPDRNCAANSDYSWYAEEANLIDVAECAQTCDSVLKRIWPALYVSFVPKKVKELLDHDNDLKWWCAPDEHVIECRQIIMIHRAVQLFERRCVRISVIPSGSDMRKKPRTILVWGR